MMPSKKIRPGEKLWCGCHFCLALSKLCSFYISLRLVDRLYARRQAAQRSISVRFPCLV